MTEPANALATMTSQSETALMSEPWWLSGWSRHISPSGLGRAAACIRSEAMPHTLDNTPHARKGTVAHKFLADCLDHGRDVALGMTEDPADIDWLMALDLERLPAFEREKYEPEVAIAYDPRTRTARCIGKGLSREEARAKAADHELVGIMDVLGATDDDAVVGDYKTGWGYVEPAEVNWQLRTYNLFSARWLGKTGGVHSVIRVRDNGSVWFDVARMDELDLMAHEEALLELLARRDHVRELTRLARWAELPPLVEGQHCRYCAAKFACPSKVAAIRLINHPLEDRSIMQGPLQVMDAAEAWKRLKAAQKTLERYEAILRDIARHTPLPLGDGEVLGEKETKRETIDPTRARTVLERQYGPLGAAVAGDATKVEPAMSKSALRSSLKRLLMPTLPREEQKISYLEKDALKLLREGGAVSARITRTVMEHTPKADAELPAGEEEAA
jgi:hypothetical protein